MDFKIYCEKLPKGSVVKCFYKEASVSLVEYQNTDLFGVSERNIVNRFSEIASKDVNVFSNQENIQKDFVELFKIVSNVKTTIVTLLCGTQLKLQYVGESPTISADGFRLLTPKMSAWWDEQESLKTTVERIKDNFPDFKPELGLNGDEYLSVLSRSSSLIPSRLTTR